jgi:hypothetical protein
MLSDEELREQAVKRIEDRRGFSVHLAIYLIVNAILAMVWLMSGGGYYWPMWTAFGWGIGVLFHGFAVFVSQREPTEERIEREVTKLRGSLHGPTPTA